MLWPCLSMRFLGAGSNAQQSALPDVLPETESRSLAEAVPEAEPGAHRHGFLYGLGEIAGLAVTSVTDCSADRAIDDGVTALAAGSARAGHGGMEDHRRLAAGCWLAGTPGGCGYRPATGETCQGMTAGHQRGCRDRNLETSANAL